MIDSLYLKTRLTKQNDLKTIALCNINSEICTMKKALPFLLPFLIISGLAWLYSESGSPKKVFKRLPILGNHKLDTTTVDGKITIDTLFHSIPSFSLINQNGETITESVVKGKVYVVDYFFTTCQSICPIMSKQLDRVYKEQKDVLILSHTVDPETDTPAILKEYASKFQADPKRWIFLTGGKPELYNLARTGYLLDAQEGNGGAEDFIHTQNFALIDKKGRIRGYYDGTDSSSVNELITDIDFLLEEK
jgi:protein SCO1/2